MRNSQFRARTVNLVLVAAGLLVTGACVDDGADTGSETLGAGADGGDETALPAVSTTDSSAPNPPAMPTDSVAPGACSSINTAEPSASATSTMPPNPPAFPTGGAAGAGSQPDQEQAGVGNLPAEDDTITSDDHMVTEQQDAGSVEPTDDDPFPGFPFPPFDDAGAEPTDDGEGDDDDEPVASQDAGASTEPGGTLEVGKLAGMTQRHNELRAEVDSDEPLPPLQWSDEIAVLAQQWADTLAETCAFEHSMRPGLGENLAEFGSSQQAGEQRAGIDAVDNWYSEVSCYGYGTISGTESCSSECDQYGGCGHYTQVVWRNSERVGCGVASCQDGQFYWDIYVCNYDPPGNYQGELPY